MAKTPANKSLSFPIDSSLGRLYISDDYVRERFLCEAQGLVEVPANRRIKLRLNESAISRLDLLNQLAPDDIHYLSLEQTSAHDAVLAPIFKLTGIEAMSLQFTKIDGSGLEGIRQMQQLTVLSAWWSRLKDIGLEFLSQLPLLESLDISRTQITDEGVHSLMRARSLRILILQENRIGDSAILSLSSLPALSHLNISGTHVSDESISALSRMQSLTNLSISRTNITQSGFLKLRQALPECRIDYEGSSLAIAASTGCPIVSP